LMPRHSSSSSPDRPAGSVSCDSSKSLPMSSPPGMSALPSSSWGSPLKVAMVSDAALQVSQSSGSFYRGQV
jgi:hypothetical protein